MSIAAQADELRSRGMACILLWMQGGPSQFETCRPWQAIANGGETKAIATSVAGIQIAENLPHCAKVMNDLALIRSVTSKEGNHQRATYLLHHGYLPMGGVKHPTLGANVAQQIGDAANELPSFVQIGGKIPNCRRRRAAGHRLRSAHSAIGHAAARRTRRSPRRAIAFDRRLRAARIARRRASQPRGGAQVVADQHKLARRAADMIHSPKMEAFDSRREPRATCARPTARASSPPAA